MRKCKLLHLLHIQWAAGPSDSLRGSRHQLKVTGCIYTLTTDKEGAEQGGAAKSVLSGFKTPDIKSLVGSFDLACDNISRDTPTKQHDRLGLSF